jgi:hypothetical protein
MRRGIASLLYVGHKGLLRNKGVLLRPLTNTLLYRPLTSGHSPISSPNPINIEINRSLIDRIINSCIPKSASDAHSKAPSLQDITRAQKGLVDEFREDKDFKKDFCELFQSSRRGNAFGIDYQVPKERDNPHGRCLIATTILSGFGLIPVLNKSKDPLFGEVVSGVGKVGGHQDTILNKKDGKRVLVEHLAIINLGGSTSDCKTWFKRNEDIVYQLKRDFPSSYYILKTINFTSNDNNKNQPIIGNDDELNFIDHSSFLPIQRDLDEHCVTKEKLLVAKLNLDKVINSEQGRRNFLLKDEGVGVSQLVGANNRLAFHGRDPGSGGVRNAIALALKKDKISITSSSVPGR